MRKVHKVTEDTVHYDLSSHTGRHESTSLLPRGGGILHLGRNSEPFSVSMFHQLRCLNLIGRELVDRLAADKTTQRKTPSSLSHHCMNYLRQMVLCRADTTLESATNPYGPHIVTRAVTHTCNDWTAVYAAAEDNYARYVDNLPSRS
ncbi:hypothetical protein AURDEDRAFT_63116 [Auricularia subglabra TFB-10046 SS5]|nr:hypothetical protein AURDEDRAFT_63116 [Auricularia subglabra TFB-10046 SS5]